MTIPRAPGFDQSLHFVRDGYDFIARQCDALGTDIFQGRLMLRNVVCMRGAPAAELLYGSDKFTVRRSTSCRPAAHCRRIGTPAARRR